MIKDNEKHQELNSQLSNTFTSAGFGSDYGTLGTQATAFTSPESRRKAQASGEDSHHD